MADSKTILSEAEEKMDMAIMYLDDALAHIRAGKADVRLLDGIRVDSYGSMVPINNRSGCHYSRRAQPSPSSLGTKACSALSKRQSSTLNWVSCPKTTAKSSASVFHR